MILKPSEKSIHSRKDLAPVAESLWCHCHILYPGRSRETTTHHRLLQSLTDRSQSEQAGIKTTGSGCTDNEEINLPKTLYLQVIAPKYPAFP